MANFTKGLKHIPYTGESDILCHQVAVSGEGRNFLMYGETTEFRVRTLFTKEPETIAWIDSFLPEDVFWDVGSNIGCYSLYAASRGIQVAAYEPSSVNYWLLTTNVALNNYQHLITALPFGLSSNSCIQIWGPNISPGSAQNQINNEEKGCALQTYKIDELIDMSILKFPSHLKIDVDGIEGLILEGANKTLSDLRLKSVLCEVDESDPVEVEKISDLMRSKGFSRITKRHPPHFDKYHYAPHFNYLFNR
jgi:FkbM family methyltransferase